MSNRLGAPATATPFTTATTVSLEALVDALHGATEIAAAGQRLTAAAARIETAVDAIIEQMPHLTAEDVHAALEARLSVRGPT
jgi:hypothetical protein